MTDSTPKSQFNDAKFDGQIEDLCRAFSAKCFDMYDGVVKKTIEEATATIYEKFINETKSNISKLVHGDELMKSDNYICMYDFEFIDDDKIKIWYNMASKGDMNTQKMEAIISFGYNQHGSQFKENKIKFLKEKYADEIFVFCLCSRPASYPGQSHPITYFMITNYGKIISFNYGYSNYWGFYFNEYRNSLDYKIPVDYINMFQLSFGLLAHNTNRTDNNPDKIFKDILYDPNTHASHSLRYNKFISEATYEQHKKSLICKNGYIISENSIILNFIETLKYIKEQQYNRKIVPLYIKDVVEENKKLLAQYNQFHDEKAEFEQTRARYAEIMREALDFDAERKRLEEQRRLLAEEKRKLKNIAIKLDMDRRTLEEEILAFEKEKKQFHELDIKKELDMNLRDDADNTCSVCLEDTGERLACGHALHKHCYLRNKEKCPICAH